MNFIYDEISSALYNAVNKGYKGGLAAVVKLNKKKILKLEEVGDRRSEVGKSFAESLFEISYNETDERLLQNFEVEAFTVASVLSYDVEEKLKAVAKSIIEGTHPYLQKHPESDVKNLWRDEAYNILSDYVEVPDLPPPGHLNTNLRTAVTSSYHAAEWQRLQELKDVYTAYRYMTRDDSKVRDEHAALHGKVFDANDPVWDVIWPPSGWNCRCYTEPLTADELSEVKPGDRIRIENDEQRKEYIKLAKVHKDFRRNSGKAESIWGKWLQTKLTNKNYGEITNKMKSFVSRMPDSKTVVEQLNKTAEPFRELEYSLGNIEKEFPGYKVDTPLGEFNFSKNFWSKLNKDEREKLFGLIKPTMTKPEYIIIDEDYGTLFLKAYEKGKKKNYVGVIGSEYGHIISFHPKNNIESKVKSGKLLVYQSERVRERGAGSPDSFVELPGLAGSASFNFADQKLSNNYDTYNEVWGEFIAQGKNKITKIRYAVDGFYYLQNGTKPGDRKPETGDGKSETGEPVEKFDTYKNIDKYRKGVLMWRKL